MALELLILVEAYMVRKKQAKKRPKRSSRIDTAKKDARVPAVPKEEIFVSYYHEQTGRLTGGMFWLTEVARLFSVGALEFQRDQKAKKSSGFLRHEALIMKLASLV